MQKDTIYIEVDDEITTVIDKLRESPSKIVALVLPKRAAMFQSVVNMKLLKRTAAEQKKNIVLITSEASILPLAGAAGIHVARSLQSKPEIPSAPSRSDQPVSVDDTPEVDESDAGTIPEVTPLPPPDEEPIEVDNDEDSPGSALAGVDKAPKTSKPFNKKLKVPNFDKFRVRLGLIVLALILLVSGMFMALVVMPKAQITVKTDITTVQSGLTITASPSVKTTDPASLTVPGELKEYKKSDSVKVSATGKKDNGTKAKGSVTLSLTDCSLDQVSVPSGTTLIAGGLNFVTVADVLLKSVKIGNQCRNTDFKDFSTATVNVLAAEAGDKYNLSTRPYTVTGFSNVSANGTAMAGGTSLVITVVSQDDINGAKQKLLDANRDPSVAELVKQLKADAYLPLADTVVVADPLVSSTPNVNDESADVTVNVTINYTMVGALQDGLKQILEADITKHIDLTKQKILDNGLTTASIKIMNSEKSGVTKFSLDTTAQAGVQQDANVIKKAVAGKKKGDVESVILSRPGVKGVDIKYSPFWVYKTPSSTKKITVVFQQSNGSPAK